MIHYTKGAEYPRLAAANEEIKCTPHGKINRKSRRFKMKRSKTTNNGNYNRSIALRYIHVIRQTHACDLIDS